MEIRSPKIDFESNKSAFCRFLVFALVKRLQDVPIRIEINGSKIQCVFLKSCNYDVPFNCQTISE